MRIHFVIASSCLASIVQLQAQTLKGHVTAEDGTPLEYANVALLASKDSTVLTGCATQADGTWTLEAGGNKECLLKVSLAGFLTQYFQMPFPNDIRLQENAAAMKEVQVSAARKYVKANPRGITVQMEDNPIGKLSTTLDALRTMPLIEGMGDDITVLGHGKPEIYIEQRKVNNISEVMALHPSEIKSVEILTQPGVRYGQDVKSVIIIHVKRKNPGLAGYVQSGGTASERLSGYANTKVSYTFTNGMSLFASAYGGTDGYKTTAHTRDRYAPENVSSDTRSTTDGRSNSLKFMAGLGKDFAKGHSVGAQYQYYRKPKSISDQKATNISTRQADTIPMSTATHTSYQDQWQYANAYATLKLSKPLTLTTVADYLWGKSPTHTAINERPEDTDPWIMNTYNLKDYQMGAAKADLDGTWEHWTMQAGVRYSYSHNNLTFRSDASEGATLFQSSENVESQNLYAIYGSTTYQPNKHWALGAGVRCEVTDFDYTQKGEANEKHPRNYTDWMPELSVVYTTSKDMSFGLNFTSRAYRPLYSDLNNNYTYLTHTSWASGNPELTSNLIKTLEASYSYNQTYVSFVYTRRYHNIQTIYRYLPEQQVNLMQNVNLPGCNDYSLNFSQSFDVKRWHPTLQGMLMVGDLRYGDGEWKKSYNKPYFYLSMKNRIDLPWDVYAWLGATWNTRGHITTAYFNRHTFTTYLQLSKSIQNWSLSLLVNDFAHTAKQQYLFDTNGVTYASLQKGGTCMAQLTVTYMFNYKNKKDYKGKSAASEEMKRF